MTAPHRRLMAKFTVGDECWLWTGALNPSGYGNVWDPATEMTRTAHRVVYEVLVGPIPGGMELDHLCRVRNCVRPDHLEPVTRAENCRRQGAARTACVKGHPYDEANTYRSPSTGHRQCRVCRADRQRNERNPQR